MDTAADSGQAENFLLYDGECPVCRRYVLWTAVRRSRPDIALLDAREAPDLVSDFRARGIEINDVMALRLDGRDYLGAEVMTKLAEIVAHETPRQRLLFKAAPTMRALYPQLALGRKILLKILGRPLIR